MVHDNPWKLTRNPVDTAETDYTFETLLKG